MGRIASVGLVREWRDRIERWRGSACGIGEFCRREGVSQASFYQWRRRLKTAVTERPGPRRAGDDGQASRFVQLPPLAWSTPAGVEIALPGGTLVRLPPQAPIELIAALVRVAMCAPEVRPASEDRPC